MFKNVLVSVVLVGAAVSLTACTQEDVKKIVQGTPPTRAEIAKSKADQANAFEQRLLSDLRVARARPNNPNEAFALAELVKFYDSEKRYGEAQILMNRAKQSWYKTHDKHEAGIAYFLTTEANLLSHMGRTRDAERLQLQVLAMNQKLLDKDSPRLVDTLQQVARFYVDHNNYQKAQPYLKRAIAICDKYPEERSQVTYMQLLKSYSTALGQTKQTAASGKKPV